jgi:hypothetical protein
MQSQFTQIFEQLQRLLQNAWWYVKVVKFEKLERWSFGQEGVNGSYRLLAIWRSADGA